MTKLLEKAIQRIRTMSPQRQDEAAEVLLGFAEQNPDSVQLSKEQQREVARRLRDPAVYATDEQVTALFQKMGV